MITATIHIQPYLAEYLYGKYGNADSSAPVRFPDNSDIYHFIYDLMIKRPANSNPIDKGNFSFYIPVRQSGKNPQTYNYFSERGVAMLQKRFFNAFCADLYDFINEQYYRKGLNYLDAAHLFATQYNITQIEDESLRKKFYRWRMKRKKKQ